MAQSTTVQAVGRQGPVRQGPVGRVGQGPVRQGPVGPVGRGPVRQGPVGRVGPCQLVARLVQVSSCRGSPYR